MSAEFVLNAEHRADMGKGASRRLRQTGKVPAIIYGSGKEPTPIMFDHNELAHQVANEAFFSHILKVNLDGKEQNAIVKDLQRHPSHPIIMHIDLQRISASETIRVNVPIHFINEELSPGVREGGLISHNISEVEVQCLPANLPEFIEADLGELDLNAIYHLTDLKLPKDVEIVELTHGDSHDQAVASVHMPRAVQETDEVEAGETDAAEGEAAEGDADATAE
ncbi:LSU ribosomal protein L25p [hydrothermal vent metagenome]|uniref:LSU ribosomal protein L25p n=1 Tax=hydrothermal vent metagenome TaxID=652676 RepID=A0A3B1A1C0_9ZZZZ